MTYEFHHVHIKAEDPDESANWYIKAFDFQILGDNVLASGAKMIRCATADGVPVNISGAGIGENLSGGDSGIHWGLEHFGVKVDNVATEIERLSRLGAVLDSGPTDVPDGPIIAFLKAPGDVRIEIIQER